MKQIIRGCGKARDIFPAITATAKKYGATTLKEIESGKDSSPPRR